MTPWFSKLYGRDVRVSSSRNCCLIRLHGGPGNGMRMLIDDPDTSTLVFARHRGTPLYYDNVRRVFRFRKPKP